MRLKNVLPLLVAAFSFAAFAPASAQTVSSDVYFSEFKPLPAPKQKGLFLKRGDRLAICGDSITEQKMYSRIMETYLTVATPELEISTRQFGWGGERAPGFLARMTNDVLRFHPTIATTCYGMNDHEYRSFEPSIGNVYLRNQMAIVESFKDHGARVVLGSAGCVGPHVPWAKTNSHELNLNLCNLRNIDVELAKKEKVRFADVFWPMLQADFETRTKYGADYHFAGKDGVHPNWAGHTVMAYAFLKALGVKGDIGTFTVDLKSNKAKATEGHEIVSFDNGQLTIKSSRYPFCAAGDVTKDDNIRSGMTLVPFNQDLNRLMLVVKKGKAARYKITWGNESKTYSAEQLEHGVNLADDFQVNPFSEAFAKVDDAVAKKQAFETKQIKQDFRSAEAKTDMEGVAAKTEKERDALVAAIHSAFVPVTHTIKISAE
jgi:lysophospholipase L1-like esterase